MRGLVRWLIVALVGFSLMVSSYFGFQYKPGLTEWEHAFMYVGKGQPQGEIEGVEYITRDIRLLGLPERTKTFTKVARNLGSHVERGFRLAFQEKVVLYPTLAEDFTNDMLRWGRLPSGEAAEVVAGFHVRRTDELTIDGQQFEVVGQFGKGVRLFADSYLIANKKAVGALFQSDGEDIQTAYIFRSAKEKLGDPKTREELQKAFPKSQFAGYAPIIWVGAGPYYVYVLGTALLLFGGSMVFYRLCCFGADRVHDRLLAPTFTMIRNHKRLFLSVQFAYFGAAVLSMLFVYLLPEVQVLLLASIKSEVADGSGILAVAGRAYMSENIFRAAVTTFAINFALGSLACITLPSVIVPGVGVLIVALRAVLWGLILAPSFEGMSGTMLPHSVTLMLEGQGYVIATFLALLVPIYLFRKSEGIGIGRRYGRAVLLNIRGNLLVAIVLAVAALYEAIEVILSM